METKHTKSEFTKSEEIFNKWREEKSDIVGYCNWEVTHNNFKLECWNSQSCGAVIFQIWSNGNGFHEYVNLTQVERTAPELLEALSSITGAEAWINDPRVKNIWKEKIYPAINKAQE